VQSLTLTAALKMFLKMPAKCQHILGEIMEKCIHDMMRNDSEKMLGLQLFIYTLTLSSAVKYGMNDQPNILQIHGSHTCT
jgi:hypothetical protein